MMKKCKFCKGKGFILVKTTQQWLGWWTVPELKTEQCSKCYGKGVR